jgi:hypothetical protein
MIQIKRGASLPSTAIYLDQLSEDTFVVAQADGSPFQLRSLTHAFQRSWPSKPVGGGDVSGNG